MLLLSVLCSPNDCGRFSFRVEDDNIFILWTTEDYFNFWMRSHTAVSVNWTKAKRSTCMNFFRSYQLCAGERIAGCRKISRKQLGWWNESDDKQPESACDCSFSLRWRRSCYDDCVQLCRIWSPQAPTRRVFLFHWSTFIKEFSVSKF